jgi:hexulose-6-phosphate isomerase
MIKAINYWSFPGEYSTAEALKLSAGFGYKALELCIDRKGPLPLTATELECKKIRADADKMGVALKTVASGLYWECSLGDPERAKRVQATQDLEQMIRMTGWLGAESLLTIPGVVDNYLGAMNPPNDYAEVLANATDGLRKIIPLAEECKVKLGIENVWNKFLLSPTEMAGFIDQFQSPWIGSYLDVANMLAYGFPEQWIKILGKRIYGVHFKDFRRSVGTIDGFVDLLEGDVNWPAVVAALEEVGYDGPVTAEMVPHYNHHGLVRVGNTSRAMDIILGRK